GADRAHARGIDAQAAHRVARLAAGAGQAVARLDAGAVVADLARGTAHARAGVEADTDAADLGVGAHHAVAGALALAGDAALAGGAGHVLARGIDAVAVGRADLPGGADELAAAAALHAGALVADHVGR